MERPLKRFPPLQRENQMSKCPIDIAQAKIDLGEWAYAEQSTLIDALRQCMEWMPMQKISRYERALDKFPKEKPPLKVKQ